MAPAQAASTIMPQMLPPQMLPQMMPPPPQPLQLGFSMPVMGPPLAFSTQQPPCQPAFFGLFQWPHPMEQARSSSNFKGNPIDLTQKSQYSEPPGISRPTSAAGSIFSSQASVPYRSSMYASSTDLRNQGYTFKERTPDPVPPAVAPAVATQLKTERSVMSSSDVMTPTSSSDDAVVMPPPRPPSPTGSQASRRSGRSSQSGTSSTRRAQGMMFKPPANASAGVSKNISSKASPALTPRDDADDSSTGMSM